MPDSLLLLLEASCTTLNALSARPAVLIRSPCLPLIDRFAIPPGVVISPRGGICAPYSSARLYLDFAQISEMASRASWMSDDTARRTCEKANSETGGKEALGLPIDCDRAVKPVN